MLPHAGGPATALLRSRPCKQICGSRTAKGVSSPAQSAEQTHPLLCPLAVASREGGVAVLQARTARGDVDIIPRRRTAAAAQAGPLRVS